MNPLNEVQKKSAYATVLKFDSAAVGRSFAPHQETLFPKLLELGARIGNRDIRLALLGELGGLSLGKAERICKRFAVPGAGFSTNQHNSLAVPYSHRNTPVPSGQHQIENSLTK